MSHPTPQSPSPAPATYTALCPDCGATLTFTVAPAQVGTPQAPGMLFLVCPASGCPWVGYFAIVSDPTAASGTPPTVTFSRSRCTYCHSLTVKPDTTAGYGVGFGYWVCPVCGWNGGAVGSVLCANGNAASGTQPPVHNHPSTWPTKPLPASPSASQSPYQSPQGPHIWGGGYAAASAMQPLTPPAPSAATQPLTPLTADVLRDEARERAYALVSGLSEALRELRASDYPTTLIGAYEAQQRALDTLYETLGGRRMGDYAPDPFNVKRDVTQIAMRLILTLCAAERMNERD